MKIPVFVSPKGIQNLYLKKIIIPEWNLTAFSSLQACRNPCLTVAAMAAEREGGHWRSGHILPTTEGGLTAVEKIRVLTSSTITITAFSTLPRCHFQHTFQSFQKISTASQKRLFSR